METINLILSNKQKYELWEKRSIFENYKTIIIQIINDGILTNDTKTFKVIFNRYIESCINYFDTVKKLNDSHKNLSKWEINFDTKQATLIFDINAVFDKNNFAINSLNLFNEFKEKICNIINN